MRRPGFLLLHGSVTGKAESIAELLAEQAAERGYEVDLCCMSSVGKHYSLEESRDRVAVLVSSTTGDGDQPEKAERLWRTLKKRHLPEDHLSGLRFAYLGLGDSNYSQFCNGPKTLRERLLDLGAEEFADPGWADDGVGLEEVVEPWIEGLWGALREVCGQTEVIRSPDREDSLAMRKRLAEKMEDKKKILEEKEAEAKQRDFNVEEAISKLSKLSVGPAGDQAPIGETLPDASGIWAIPQPEEEPDAPDCPPSYLKVTFGDETPIRSATELKESFSAFPLAVTKLLGARITGIDRLTSDPRVKRAYKVALGIKDASSSLELEPGDALSLVCPNPRPEVDAILARLGLAEKRLSSVSVALDPISAKKRAKVPDFVPEKCSLEELLTWHLDLRTPPKKPLLRCLAERTSVPGERLRLLHFCSKGGGAADYLSNVRGRFTSLLDLLLAMPGCRPKLGDLLEHLPRLQPRPYSIASDVIEREGGEKEVEFVFNVVDFSCDGWRRFPRRGVGTGWIEDIAKEMMEEGGAGKELLVFGRKSTGFRLPPSIEAPIVMVGPGTGVAPFRGFLQRRKKKMLEEEDKECGEAWLFFGCRHKEADFLFRDDLEAFKESGVLTELRTVFSRDDPASETRYVQHAIRESADKIAEILGRDDSVIYVCGDARNMSKDVNEAVVQALARAKGMTQDKARDKVAEMMLNKRYLQDVWT